MQVNLRFLRQSGSVYRQSEMSPHEKKGFVLRPSICELFGRHGSFSCVTFGHASHSPLPVRACRLACTRGTHESLSFSEATAGAEHLLCHISLSGVPGVKEQAERCGGGGSAS